MSQLSGKLRSVSHRLLTPSQCQQLRLSVQAFESDQSVFSFCASLKLILGTREQMQILMLLHSMVPQNLLSDFDSLCCIHFEHYKKPKIQGDLQKKHRKSFPRGTERKPRRQESVLEPATGTVHANVRRKSERRRTRSTDGTLDTDVLLQRLPGRKDKKGEDKERKRERKRSKTAHVVLGGTTAATQTVPNLNLNTGSHDSGRGSRTHQLGNVKVWKIKLENRAGESLGFCIRGGKDLHAGIYVSSIDPGGQADAKGLKVGERILKVNDTALKDVTHAEAVVAIKSSHKLTLYMAQMGQMPGTPRKSASKTDSTSSNVERTVLLVADDDGFLGCSIRGGVDFGLPVTVASVDPLSPAYRAGLHKGELVLKVNGQDICGLNHLEVVELMTNSNVVKMLLMPNQSSHVKRRSSCNADLRRSPRFKNEDKQSTVLVRNISSASQLPSTPIRIRRRDGDVSMLENEIYSTPPRSTSTPLPTECHSNQDQPLNESLFSSDRPVGIQLQDQSIPVLHLQEVDQKRDVVEDRLFQNTSGGSSVENVSPHDFHKKFEMGTIRLNLDDKNKVRGDKILDVGGATKGNKRRESVQNMFPPRQQLKDETMGEDDDKEINGNEKHHDHHMNILSSPPMNISRHSLKMSGKVSPLLLPLQNIGVSRDSKKSSNMNQHASKKNRLSLSTRIFGKKGQRGSVSSNSTSAYSSSESLDTLVQGRQLPSIHVTGTNKEWIMY